MWIANLIRYKREGFQPDRDIVVALTADEEGGVARGGHHRHRRQGVTALGVLQLPAQLPQRVVGGVGAGRAGNHPRMLWPGRGDDPRHEAGGR